MSCTAEALERDGATSLPRFKHNVPAPNSGPIDGLVWGSLTISRKVVGSTAVSNKGINASEARYPHSGKLSNWWARRRAGLESAEAARQRRKSDGSFDGIRWLVTAVTPGSSIPTASTIAAVVRLRAAGLLRTGLASRSIRNTRVICSPSRRHGSQIFFLARAANFV
jgi:hypothetical protein